MSRVFPGQGNWIYQYFMRCAESERRPFDYRVASWEESCKSIDEEEVVHFNQEIWDAIGRRETEVQARHDGQSVLQSSPEANASTGATVGDHNSSRSNSVREHSHYFKDVSYLKEIDVYRVLTLFGVTDPCIQHAVKKLLVAGGRGAGKSVERDIREAIVSLNRCLQMIAENDHARIELPPMSLEEFSQAYKTGDVNAT